MADHDDLAITYAAMLGAVHRYNDYGHSERAQARMYHTFSLLEVEGWGYTAAHAAKSFLRRSGRYIDKEGNLCSNFETTKELS
jgi:hypothetical protein